MDPDTEEAVRLPDPRDPDLLEREDPPERIDPLEKIDLPEKIERPEEDPEVEEEAAPDLLMTREEISRTEKALPEEVAEAAPETEEEEEAEVAPDPLPESLESSDSIMIIPL